MRRVDRALRSGLVTTLLFLCTTLLHAGGPRWVAGSSYFDPAAKGLPIVWRNGIVSYYTDLGNLSPVVTQTKANAMVATAANVWSSVSTAAVSITRGGSLAEDVNGTNVYDTPNGSVIPTVNMPADIQSTATGLPVGVVYDYDGTVIDAILGVGASDPLACNQSSVVTLVDNLPTNGSIAHALMILNGRCAADSTHIEMMQYMLIRAFGRVLGLDWSQANEAMFISAQTTASGLAGWPIMHAVERMCTSALGPCMSKDTSLRLDDIAALSRLYPVTGAVSGKSITAQTTISIQGTLHFAHGQGMQGVNVVVQPLISGTTTPDFRYTVTAVSGSLFQGIGANPVWGPADPAGVMRNKFGSDDPALEGWFDVSGIPLPGTATQADYQVTFEAINPLYTGFESIGPYAMGQVTPSGTMPVLILRGLSAGSSQQVDVIVPDSATDCNTGNDGSEAAPANMPRSGEWTGRICGYGHAGWFQFFARGNRGFTVETMALGNTGQPSADKAAPLIGIWNAYDAVGTVAQLGTPQPFDGDQVGLSFDNAQTSGDEEIRVAIADARGDGRPDYWYRGRLLYADSVTPIRVGSPGGAITITGTGFRGNSQVLVNGVAALVTSVTPTIITAVAPPAGSGVTGDVDLTVSDPATLGIATILGGFSYDASASDSLGLAAAPPNSAPMGVAQTFGVRALMPDDVTPAPGVTVTFTIAIGTAILGCGGVTCTAITGGDGTAFVMVTPTCTSMAAVTGTLNNGSTIKVEFTGVTPAQVVPLSPALYLAIGGTSTWSPQALVLNGTTPSAGQSITWTGSTGLALSTAAQSVSDATGLVSTVVTVGPLAANAQPIVNACLSGSTPGSTGCATFTIYAVHTQTSTLVALSGAGQTLTVGTMPAPVVLRVVDAIGHPLAGGIVTFYEALTEWQPKCSPHGRCASAPVLGEQTVVLTTGPDGLAALLPMARTATPTRLNILAVTGSTATLSFSIETRP